MDALLELFLLWIHRHALLRVVGARVDSDHDRTISLHYGQLSCCDDIISSMEPAVCLDDRSFHLIIPLIYWPTHSSYYGSSGVCFPLHIDEPYGDGGYT